MSRDVRRVPLDFEWPLNKVWHGYLMPERLHGNPCPDCKNGYAPHAQHLFDLWYGYVPFDPRSTGSEPLSHRTPAVRAFAERNIARAPGYYGTGEVEIVREAARLAELWNGMWSHHLSQDDVDALVDGDRLWDLTRRWNSETGWEKIDPPVRPTAEQINEWAIRTMGHDSLNASIVIRARCEREGFDVECPTCQRHSSVEVYPGQRAEAEAWEWAEPPRGEGWQLWETVTEGSPITPVFATADELIGHMVSALGFRQAAAAQVVADGGTFGTGAVINGKHYDTAKDADLLAEKRAGR